MAENEELKVNVKNSLIKSLEEVEKIRNDKLPKRSYKEMINRIRENLKENEIAELRVKIQMMNKDIPVLKEGKKDAI